VTDEPFTLRVRHGLEYVDGRPVGVVYLVDRRDPLVEITYALPISEAYALAATLRVAASISNGPFKTEFRTRDGGVVELTVQLASARHAFETLRRHAESATILRGRGHHEVAA